MVVVCGYYAVRCRTKEKWHTVDTVDILTKYVEVIRPKLGKAVDIHQKRAQTALSNWQNGILDPEPILVSALLEHPVGREQVFLRLMTFDEDGDIAGFGINEQLICADGSKRELMEQYPVFIHRGGFFVGADIILVPVQIRDAGQQKPEQQWQEYLGGEGIAMDKIKSADYWRDTLPEIWVSIPDPNIVEVDVHIYDRSDHKSQPVRLECLSASLIPSGQSP